MLVATESLPMRNFSFALFCVAAAIMVLAFARGGRCLSAETLACNPGEPAKAASNMTRICITEWPGYYSSPEADFRKRFALYEQCGIDTIRVENGWLDRPAMVNALKDTRFKIKLILYVLAMPKDYVTQYPAERMVDENGAADRHLGPWSRDFAETTLRTGRTQIEKLTACGLAARVDEVVVDLGPAGEGIYPANWTLQRKGEEAFWCYSGGAQESFRDSMKGKYPSIDAANIAWALTGMERFNAWDEVAIPKPRTAWARGPFWNDMLIWYRDAKRQMMLNRIEQTQRLVKESIGRDVKCIVYLPGYAYSQADWDRAVREASGPSSIRLMMDNDWLMTTAIAKGCVLQYTGAENATEVGNIVRKLKAAGSDAYATMWGENAGVEAIGRNPGQLAEVITGNGLRGIDFTWSNWLFEKDGVTPSETFVKFASAVRTIDVYGNGDHFSRKSPSDATPVSKP